MAQQVDGSGRFAEALSPTSPATGHASPMTETIDSAGPIPMEFHEGFTPATDKKGPDNTFSYYSAPEVVDPGQYAQYGQPPSGSPPVTQDPSKPFKAEYQVPQEYEAPPPQYTPEVLVLGMKKRVFRIVLAVAIVVIVLAVGIGAGLGAGLKKKSSKESVQQDPFCASHPELCIGGYLDSRYYSQKGAFNGSGIALAGESWNKNERRLFTLFFQHHSGDIRYMAYGVDQKWAWGNSSSVIATDAKNGSAISAVQYQDKNITFTHLFYISEDNLMKQKTWTNDTNKWEDGIVSGMKLAVHDDPGVGMQACWKGDFYGDTDASNFDDSVDTKVGINLWYPSDDSTFQQYAWYRGSDKWEKLNPWLGKNVHAGVGCYSWEAGSTTSYTMMVNQQNVTEIWWRDTNTNLTASDKHPIMSWTNSTNGGISGVYPSTSMGYTNYLYMQMADKSIKGFNIEYTAETTHSLNDTTITNPAGPVAGLPGTHLTCTSYALKEGTGNSTRELWNSLYVFYQTKGDDITAFTRPFLGGEWTQGSLIIPQD